MAYHNLLPHVVIVGRVNVGKSTLFNRLAKEVRSIASDREGVTRDILKDIVSWRGKHFTLLDTGGIIQEKKFGPFDKELKEKIQQEIERAHHIIFITDGTAGLVPEDRSIARYLHTFKKQTTLVINKVDNKRLCYDLYEFDKLGFTDSIEISAEHGTNVSLLLDRITEKMSDKISSSKNEKQVANIVFIGKPNVGKSSLINLLLKKKRTVVSDIPGTTREAISDYITFYQQDICLVDTAGVRRKHNVNDSLEKLMVKSTMQAIRKADVVVLLVDSSEGNLTDQELKLAYYVFEEQHKGLIILYNKTDIQDEYAKQCLNSSISKYKHLLQKVETLSISCKTEKNIGRIIPLIKKVIDRYQQNFDNDDIALKIQEWLMKTPLYRCKAMMKVYALKQISSAPITMRIYTNMPKLFLRSHEQFFDNRLRKDYSLKSIPIKFIVHSSS